MRSGEVRKDPPTKKKGSGRGLIKPLTLSPDLAAIVGTKKGEKLSRADTTKVMFLFKILHTGLYCLRVQMELKRIHLLLLCISLYLHNAFESILSIYISSVFGGWVYTVHFTMYIFLHSRLYYFFKAFGRTLRSTS